MPQKILGNVGNLTVATKNSAIQIRPEMGEAKQCKALDEMYGIDKLPESARPFIRTLQEAVERQARMNGTGDNPENALRFFLDGVLNSESGIYELCIPAKFFDFSEYPFRASIKALTGFMGTIRFGMAIHSSTKKREKGSASPAAEVGQGSVIMMLTCVNGAWFYTMVGDRNSVQTIGKWDQAELKDMALSDQLKQFMGTIEEALKKSDTLKDKVKTRMTLDFLKEHYHATMAASKKTHTGGDASIN